MPLQLSDRVQEITPRRAFAIGLRARFPLIARTVAIVILTAGIGFIGISYYQHRNNKKFWLTGKTPELSKEITGRIEGYEQRVTKGDRLYLLLKAAVDITYSDGHHELEAVNLTVYPPEGDKPDQISAARAIYDQKNSMITFLGNVKIETKDALKVNTESLSYNQDTEIAHTEAPMTFTRENVSGRSTGAVVESKNKKLELKNAVEITVAPEVLKDPKATVGSSRSRPVTIRSAHASFEQASMKLSFYEKVTVDQGRDTMSGDNLIATLNEQKRLQKLSYGATRTCEQWKKDVQRT